MNPRLSTLPVLIACGLLAGSMAARADGWKEYARSAMTPDFSWAQGSEAVVPDSRMVVASALSETVRAEFNAAVSGATVELQLSQSRGNDLVASNVASLGMFDENAPGLAQRLVGLQLSHEFDGGVRVGAGVVVAEQQFASFGLGSHLIDSGEPMQMIGAESATAAGVRLNAAQMLGERVSVQAALQSKIDMQPFQSYRGVFSDPGDFDLPARAEVSARIALSPRLGLALGTQRVMYSEINAFSSYALPERFLSLLGDGTSPDFAWRDLTVYDVRMDYSIGRASRIDFRYSTQQQPEPSSTLLYNALSDEFTDRNFALGVSHRFERAGELSVAASHAPIEYFLGNSSALGRGDAGGEQFEVEARWRVDF